MNKSELLKQLRKKYDDELDEKIERYRVLLSIFRDQERLVPGTAYQYYEEARLCWLEGAYIATIIFVQMTFEEFFRSRYRMPSDEQEIISGVKAKDTLRSGFNELVKLAKKEKIITLNEYKKLQNLRKIRNSITHTKRPKIKNGKQKLDGFDSISLEFKFRDFDRFSITKDAKKTIKLLTIFDDLVERCFVAIPSR